MLQLELDLTQEQAELEDILRSVCKTQDDLVQFDFLREGKTIIRHQPRERVWTKITDGAWSKDDVQALIRHGLIHKVGQSAMGWEIRPRPELIGAL